MQEFIMVPENLKVLSRTDNKMIVTNSKGKTFEYSGDVIKSAVSNTLYGTTNYVSRSAVIDELLKLGRMIASVTFIKQDKTKTSRTVYNCSLDRMGYINCTDVEKEFIPDQVSSFIRIDCRTIESAVINNINYIVK